MKAYKCLHKQEYFIDCFRIIPIRFEDRYLIMNWRNEQIFHLRQKEPLTKEQQDLYFETVVKNIFDQKQPSQILFSFLLNEEFLGYGGLVHINWIDKNAEVSFLTKKSSELSLWVPFLKLLKNVAFEELNFHKIYTFSFDVRPRLYEALDNSGFFLEGVFSNHCSVNNRQQDVRIHSCFNDLRYFWCRQVVSSDARLLYSWANDSIVRASSLDGRVISWPTHLDWFHRKLQNRFSRIFIYYHKNNPIGTIRFDLSNDGYKVSYLVDSSFRGKGFGKLIIFDAVERNFGKLMAEVKIDNFASNIIFRKAGFDLVKTKNGINTWIYVK